MSWHISQSEYLRDSGRGRKGDGLSFTHTLSYLEKNMYFARTVIFTLQSNTAST